MTPAAAELAREALALAQTKCTPQERAPVLALVALVHQLAATQQPCHGESCESCTSEQPSTLLCTQPQCALAKLGVGEHYHPVPW